MFTKTTLQTMLTTALGAIESNLDYLNSLDAATGDGDHGTAILAAMRAAAKGAQADGTLAETLQNVGWGVMSEASGSTSSLTGSFYMGMGEAVKGEMLSLDETIDIFRAGLKNVQASTKAKIGDKTLMDALIPAIEAMESLKGTPSSMKQLFEAAAKAARAGAESTKEMVAKQGRARNLGERTKGHYDAGAESTAIIYEAFAGSV